MAESPDADIFPVPGRISKLSGKITCTPQPGEEIVRVDVTLSPDTGRRTQSTSCLGSYLFDGLAPGNCEIMVSEAVWPKPVARGGPVAAFHDLIGYAIWRRENTWLPVRGTWMR